MSRPIINCHYLKYVDTMTDVLVYVIDDFTAFHMFFFCFFFNQKTLAQPDC